MRCFLNTKQIEYILELAKTQNYNRAAENLFISQPTLTYQIKAIEQEIGFPIFKHSGKGTFLTPVGEQFCTTLKNVQLQIKDAIELGQNFYSKYLANINIGLPVRSAIYNLPEIIKDFEKKNEGISITPHFLPLSDSTTFLKREEDILFAMEHDVKHLTDTKIYPFYKSKIYLITMPNDKLAEKKIITIKDLIGRSLMVGGGSPPALQKVQQRVIQQTGISYFNSPNHDTTLTNVAVGKGICLAPGFLNDRHQDYVWIPFDCEETVNCVLCVHSNETRKEVFDFVKALKSNIHGKNTF